VPDLRIQNKLFTGELTLTPKRAKNVTTNGRRVFIVDLIFIYWLHFIYRDNNFIKYKINSAHTTALYKFVLFADKYLQIVVIIKMTHKFSS